MIDNETNNCVEIDKKMIYNRTLAKLEYLNYFTEDQGDYIAFIDDYDKIYYYEIYALKGNFDKINRIYSDDYQIGFRYVDITINRDGYGQSDKLNGLF